MPDPSPPDRPTLQRMAEHALMGRANVVGVDADVDANGGVIRVLVTRKLPESALGPGELVPRTLEGFPTEVVELGAPAIEEERP